MARQEVLEQDPVDGDAATDDREVHDPGPGHLLEARRHVLVVERRRVRGAEDHAVEMPGRRRRTTKKRLRWAY